MLWHQLAVAGLTWSTYYLEPFRAWQYMQT